MASIMCLPEELIARILSYNDISIEDIINFRCTCKQFEWAAKYGKYWEKKFSQRRAGCDLTERYCNIKLFYYLRYHLIREYWERFEEQPHKKLLLELGATIIVQRFQPQKDVFYSIIKTSLDNIALEVLNYLREEHPDHSIFSTTAENFAYWKNNNIDDNHWDEMEGTQIMNALEEYIFDKLNFKLNKSKNIDYMCIDNVLERKCGEEIILFIIYQSVARRLGLRCDIIKLPHCSRVCIFWKPKYVTSSLEDVRCFNLSYATFPDCLVEQRCSEKPLAITAEEIRQNLIEILICMNVEWCKNTLAPMPPKAIRDVWDINLREVFLLYNSWGDMNMTVEGIVNIILVTGATTKLVNIVTNNKKLINKFGQTQEVIRFGCIVMGSITHLLSMCLPGQLLLDRSIEIFDKAQMGIWPYQHRMIKILLPCFLVLSEASLFVTQILLVHNTWGDMNMAVEGIVNMILLTGATTKLLNIVINNKKVILDLIMGSVTHLVSICLPGELLLDSSLEVFDKAQVFKPNAYI
ncbi:F-box only protein 21 [Camponotus floridanus]|uniref:F-box only protein 21 n=1 Tax=Camponotus floridanus TaxID=104421 RepID=E2AKV8_CAMFO|nr:F-box only protein 21 [Camponotus floridanus]